MAISLAFVIVPVQPVSAISDSDAVWCGDNIKIGENLPSGWSKHNCEEVCDTDTEQVHQGPVTTIIKKVKSCDDAAIKAARVVVAEKNAMVEAYTQALGREFGCGGSAGPCIDLMRQAAAPCLTAFFNNGYDNSQLVYPDIDAGIVANCIAPKINRDKDKIKNVLVKAAPDAKKSAENAGSDARTRSDKKACDAKGSEWEWRDSEGCVEKAGAPKPVCAGGVLGWALCPVLTIVTEALGTFIAMIDDFMRFDPLMGSQQGQAVFVVWRIVVNMANLGLVIAFLVVIFSQATSFGLSSYGVKKMLPRIIAAAILINISFYLCAILVDIFNVIGASIAGIIGRAFEAIPIEGTAVAQPGSGFVDGAMSFVAWTGTFLTAFSAVLIASITGSIGFVVPFVLGILAAAFLIFLVLALRHTIALLLVMISPLAFAAMILPGTDGLFKKWWKALWMALALYPIIMALAYGSMLVSKIMLTLVSADEVNTLPGAFKILIALFVNVAWIFALKFIMSWGAGVIGRVAGMVNDKSKGWIDRSRNKAKEWKERSDYQQGKSWRKKAADDNRAANLAKRLQGKGGWKPYNIYSQIAARGVGGNLGRIPGVKDVPILGSSWQAQNEIVDRAARGRVATAMSEEVKAEMARLSTSEDGRSITSIRDYVRNNASTLSDTQMRAAGELLLSKPGAKGSFRKLLEDSSIMKNNAAEGLVDAGLSSDGFKAAHPDMSNALEKANLVGIGGDVATGKLANYTGANFVAGAGGTNSRGIQMVEDSFNWEKVARRADSVLKVSENNADHIKNYLTQETAIAARDSGEIFAGADPNIKNLINHVANGNPGSTWVAP